MDEETGTGEENAALSRREVAVLWHDAKPGSAERKALVEKYPWLAQTYDLNS